jgi:small subunit ribosomal protein S35
LTAPLRFRYTTYMGEAHPAAKKIVVQFCTRDIPSLTERQRIKLIKLAGVRYNPDTDVVKISCEKFEEPAQNKRYLGDLVQKLIKEAQNEEDMFEDVPLDFRHHKPKKRLVYPEGWKLREENVKRLLEARREVRLLEEQKPAVNGAEIVQEYVRMLPARGSGLLGQNEQPSGARKPIPVAATKKQRLAGVR